MRENKAPNRIEFDVNDPIKKEFTVSDNDIEGKEYKIENKKKTTDINVEKIQKDSQGKIVSAPSAIKIQLYRNNQPLGKAVELSANNLTHKWEKLDITDDYGNPYKYTVKEVGEKFGKIKLNNEFYMVEVKGSEKDGYITVNKKQQLKLAEVNKPLPKTGDGNKLLVYIALIGLSIIGLIVLKTIKKKDCFSNLR